MYTCCLLPKNKEINKSPNQMEASLQRMLPGQGCCAGLVRLGTASQQAGQGLCPEEGGSRAERIFMCERLSGLER